MAPKVGERIYDPCCGTGGFLAQAAEYLVKKVDAGEGLPKGMSQAAAKEIVKHQTFYGREKENLIYPIGASDGVRSRALKRLGAELIALPSYHP